MKPAGRKRCRRPSCSEEDEKVHTEDLQIDMAVDYTTPGSALDDQLRREQARVVFALLTGPRGPKKTDDDGD